MRLCAVCVNSYYEWCGGDLWMNASFHSHTLLNMCNSPSDSGNVSNYTSIHALTECRVWQFIDMKIMKILLQQFYCCIFLYCYSFHRIVILLSSSFTYGGNNKEADNLSVW